MRSIKNIVGFHLDCYFLFLTDLTDGLPNTFGDNFNPESIKVRQYKPDDIEFFVKFFRRNGYFGKDELQIKEHLKSWFSHGYECVIALDGKEVVGMGWFCIGSYKSWPAFGRFPGLPQGTGLLFNDFVQKEYRGKAIHKRIVAHRSELMIDKGVVFSCSFVGVKNFASTNNYLKLSKKYRLVYNLIIDLPRGTKISVFLNKAREGWVELT